MNKSNKLMLEGLGNDGYRYHYEFQKIESFEKDFILLMLELGFGIDDLNYVFESPKIRNGETRWKKLRVKEINQKLHNFRNKNFDVDVVFWEKTITIVIRTKKKKELIKAIEKRFKFEGE